MAPVEEIPTSWTVNPCTAGAATSARHPSSDDPSLMSWPLIATLSTQTPAPIAPPFPRVFVSVMLRKASRTFWPA